MSRARSNVASAALSWGLSAVVWFVIGVAAADPTLTTIDNFTAARDGRYPYAAVIFDNVVGRQSALYGTTVTGGASGQGTVFKLAPPATPGNPWTETILYSFKGGADGGQPASDLVFDTWGAVYGTTLGGGAYGQGTVFKLTPPATPGNPWTESVLYSFRGGFGGNADGSAPVAGVIFDAFGNLYGTTLGGGAHVYYGTVFKLTPPSTPSGSWTETVLYSFQNSDGYYPYGGVIVDTWGALYGTTAYGGQNGVGTVYKLTPPSTPSGPWTETVLHSFTAGSDGSYPYAGVIVDTWGVLYGTTYSGGQYGAGTVFKLTPASSPPWNESVVYNFTRGSDGSNPFAGVIFDTWGALYGTTAAGGQNGAGTVFKLMPGSASANWTEMVLHDFTGRDGMLPSAGVVFELAKLYGTTVAGGTRQVGTVFVLAP